MKNIQENKKIIILNVGSSSCKFQIFYQDFSLIGKALIDRIGLSGTNITYKPVNGNPIKKEQDLVFDDLVDFIVQFLTKEKVVDFNDVYLMVHRVVNGADVFKEDIIIDTNEKLEKLITLNPFAPLHNPYNNAVLKTFYQNYPHITQAVVFDTTFHSTIPELNYMYALPYELYEKHKLRRYGAHGSSHAFITNQMEKYLGKEKINIINLHLGNGASACLINDSKSLNTSMGFTPLAGLVMGTRTGDIDPAIAFHLINQLNMDPKEVDTIFNKKSGLLGIYGPSSDMRDIIKAQEEGNHRAALARALFSKRIADYLGMYFNEVPKIEAITFTGGIGENDFAIIRQIISFFHLKEIKLIEKFSNKEEINKISAEDSAIAIYIVPTNEELYMAQVGKKLLGEK